MPEVRLGTRGSQLALAQSRWVAGALERMGWGVTLHVIKTTGDQVTSLPLGSIGAKGLFVSEIEQALLAKEVDLAVHSMKDLPGEMPAGLVLAAVPEREDPRDVTVGRTASTLESLARGAVVGTSSPRRKAQILAMRPDLNVTDIRGNLDTRLRKLDQGQYDAICVAAAGVHRLGLSSRITEYLPLELMVPCVGQGALAIQIRSGETNVAQMLSTLHHEPTGIAVRAERTVLAALGGGCSIPLGALCVVRTDALTLTAALCSPDGTVTVREQIRGAGSPEDIGLEMAERLRSRGRALL